MATYEERLAAFNAVLAAWRAKSEAEQIEWFNEHPTVGTPKMAAVDPAIRDRVNSCPDRGSELPVSAYITEGCCTGPTRFECRAGKGIVSGQPTLRDCLECQSIAINAEGSS